ncbi:hypothetical protein Cni_G26175 [Canna indica]|uniref:Uncharacterized protein n=1 Tax=Canna indica TaxID=4628 RepID=A0AAQ3QQ12_9LILI|nr:hypothetical protein Cni_G26175 [Canna indica]
MHWISWHTLCRLKIEGSFSFKDLKAFNLAMLGGGVRKGIEGNVGIEGIGGSETFGIPGTTGIGGTDTAGMVGTTGIGGAESCGMVGTAGIGGAESCGMVGTAGIGGAESCGIVGTAGIGGAESCGMVGTDGIGGNVVGSVGVGRVGMAVGAAAGAVSRRRRAAALHVRRLNDAVAMRIAMAKRPKLEAMDAQGEGIGC